jgi:creatinine amidohydrolase
MLHETVSEMARNGCSKVILVNGHGGNNNLVQYFVQTQLASPRD